MELRHVVTGSDVGARGLVPLRGEITRLRAIQEADLPLLVRWMNDPDVRYWLHHSDRPDAMVATVRGRFGLTYEAFPNLVWMIETAEGRPTGHVGLLQWTRTTGERSWRSRSVRRTAGAGGTGRTRLWRCFAMPSRRWGCGESICTRTRTTLAASAATRSAALCERESCGSAGCVTGSRSTWW